MTKIKDLKIAAYGPSMTGCDYYRIMLPMMYMRQHALCKDVVIYNAVSINSSIAHGDKSYLDEMAECDIILAHYTTTPHMLEDLQYLKSKGCKIIVDLDDLIDDLDDTNPAKARLYADDMKLIQSYFGFAKLADGIIVTTYELKEAYKALNPNIHIVDNYIDFEMRNWTQHINIDKIIHIGWTGSTSHLEDINIMGEAVRKVMKKYNNVVLALFCDHITMTSMVCDHKLPTDRIVYIRPVDFSIYPTRLPEIDIGLAPIADTPFNRSKSALKVKEYCASSIPYIASNVNPYTRYCDHGYDGFLANNTDEWVKYMSMLIKDRTLYETMANNGYEKSAKYDMANNIYRWTKAWEDICDGRQQEPEDTVWFKPVVK